MKPIRTYGLNRNPDYWLIAAVIMLLLVGIILVYSASAWHSYMYSEDESDTARLRSHLLRLLGGLVAMVFLCVVDYHTWQDWRMALLIWLVPLGMLVYLWFDNLGSPPGLANRWFMQSIFHNSVQPSEFAKPAIILYIAAWLCSKGDKIRDINEGLLPFGTILGLTAGFIIIQPHLSATLVIGLTAVFIYFVAGAQGKHLLLIGIIAAIVVIGTMLGNDYMTDRWGGFVGQINNPDDNVKKSEQYDQIDDAYRQGGPFGKGLGRGTIKNTGALSMVSDTDLIMTVAGEELGLIGTWLIIGLYGLFAWRGFSIAKEAPDQFGALLAVGITFWITLQAVIHALVNARLGPITGMHLPFVSYGGSALVTEMAGIGLLINISRSAVREGKPSHEDFAFGGGYRGPRYTASRRR